VGSIFIGPFDGCSCAIVGTDVAHKFTIKIFKRSEDAAGNDRSLNLGEPEFDLVKPG
jgi:hypothetical protein